jgi:hypothetical protein
LVAISTVPNQPHLYKQRVRRSNHRDVGRKPSAVPYSYTWMVVIQKTEMLLSGYSHYRFALVFNSLVFRPSPTDTDDSDEAEAGTSDIHIPFTRFYCGNRSLERLPGDLDLLVMKLSNLDIMHPFLFRLRAAFASDYNEPSATELGMPSSGTAK